MKQDEIIEMARQAGGREMVSSLTHPNGPTTAIKFHVENGSLEAFAKLVADKKDAEHKEAMRWDVHTCGPTCKRYACVAIREAVKAERETIKELAEKELLNTSALMSMPPQSSAAWNILQAIRARGEA